MDFNYFRTALKKYRAEHVMTQEQLAELLNTDPTYISMLETGKRTPSTDFLIAISNNTGLSIDYLLCGKSNSGARIKLNESFEKIMAFKSDDRLFLFKMIDELIAFVESKDCVD